MAAYALPLAQSEEHTPETHPASHKRQQWAPPTGLHVQAEAQTHNAGSRKGGSQQTGAGAEAVRASVGGRSRLAQSAANAALASSSKEQQHPLCVARSGNAAGELLAGFDAHLNFSFLSQCIVSFLRCCAAARHTAGGSSGARKGAPGPRGSCGEMKSQKMELGSANVVHNSTGAEGSLVSAMSGLGLRPGVVSSGSFEGASFEDALRVPDCLGAGGHSKSEERSGSPGADELRDAEALVWSYYVLLNLAPLPCNKVRNPYLG